MEKVKITVEQEESIKTWAFDGNELRNHIANFIYVRNMGGLTIRPELFWLNNVTVEDFAKILCGWYEVEQPFEVGEWVYNIKREAYRKIHESRDSIKDSVIPLWFVVQNSEMYEKVIEPWKIMLLNEGREKPELKVGDMYVTKAGNTFIVSNEKYINNDIARFKNGIVKRFYPVEKSIEVINQ